MRLRLSLLACLLALPAMAQQPQRAPAQPRPAQPGAAAAPAATPQPPLVIRPCVAILPDGQETPLGFNFAAVANGRLALLLTRTREGETTATDFSPVPTLDGGSFFMQNFDVRIGERPVSIFWLATVRANGLILIERWRREDARPVDFAWHDLRCTP